MNSNSGNITAGKVISICFISVVLSVVATLLVVMEFSIPSALILIPAFVLVYAYCHGGRVALTISAVLQIMINAFLVGTQYMYIMTFACIMPTITTIQSIRAGKGFFAHLRRSLFSYLAGYLIAIIACAISLGGNVVANLLQPLSDMMRSIPQDYMEGLLASFNAMSGMKMAYGDFLVFYDQVVNQMISSLQFTLPGNLFSGAVITAVVSVTYQDRFLRKRGMIPKESFVPMKDWSLPGSTVIGMLLILAVSYAMNVMKLSNGEIVFYSVLCLSEAVFSIQTASSIMRRVQVRGLRIAMIIILAAGIPFGLLFYSMLYGIASSIFGSKGILHTNKMENDNEER